jgi:hypothetical protein
VVSEPSRLVASLRVVDGKPSFAVSFRRLLLAHELDYVIQASQDLRTWAEVKADAEEQSLNPDGTLTSTLRFTPVEHSSALSYRLRVSRKPVP